MEQKESLNRKGSKGAASGAVALIFLILGFQSALFVTKILERIPADSLSVEDAVPELAGGGEILQDGAGDSPTGHTTDYAGESSAGYTAGNTTARAGASARASARGRAGSGAHPGNHSGTHSGARTGTHSGAYAGTHAGAHPGKHSGARTGKRTPPVAGKKSRLGGYGAAETGGRPPRRVESFRFDPNTATLDELERLGLSERQAEVILRYREKGGRFRRKGDFAKMYVVSDTLFERLEPFIDIPKTDLNRADSAALVQLPGIGPYYARMIIACRDSLGGFYDKRQLLGIKGFDDERFATLEDLVTADPRDIRKLRPWEMDEDALAGHPYIGRRRARALRLYAGVADSSGWSVRALLREQVLDTASLERLRPYLDLGK